MTNRRAFLFGAGAALAAPALVPASSLMKLWVPPKPALVTVTVDLAKPLFDATGLVVGWWLQHDGGIDFRWDDPKPTGYYHHGTNHSFSTAYNVMKMLDVTPYKDRPFVRVSA